MQITIRQVILATVGSVILVVDAVITPPHRCTAAGNFGPTIAKEPCFDQGDVPVGNQVNRCDFVSCTFYASYNTWVKAPHVCPGDPTNVFDDKTGLCGPLPVTSTTVKTV